MNGTNETPAISRYIVAVTITGAATATFVELLNTTGVTITPTRGNGTIHLTAASATFIAGKTFVVDSAKDTPGVQCTVGSITTTAVNLDYVQAGADFFILDVYTVNI